jgi:hypothetical protein
MGIEAYRAHLTAFERAYIENTLSTCSHVMITLLIHDGRRCTCTEISSVARAWVKQ